jgi:hypothetical protein
MAFALRINHRSRLSARFCVPDCIKKQIPVVRKESNLYGAYSRNKKPLYILTPVLFLNFMPSLKCTFFLMTQTEYFYF